MPKLIIERTSEWVNSMRDIAIYLNNERVGAIGNGKTLEIEVAPGTNSLKARIDWCGSESYTFNTANSETVKVRLSASKFVRWIPVFFLFPVVITMLNAIFDLSKEVSTLLILIPVLYGVYQLTIRRNRYLRLTKI